MSYFKYNNHNIFYTEIGEGFPLLLLHGNTSSSNMFLEIATKYSKDFKVILIDFLGYGKSDHVHELNEDLWYYQANQVACLLKETHYTKVNIIGTSGGAITAINFALEYPHLVNKLIADSFEGEKADSLITKELEKSREESKKDIGARGFYEMMNGENWEEVVDADTKAMVNHAQNIVNFFHKPISELKVDVLFTGSKEDPFFPERHYEKLFNEFSQKVEHGHFHIFESGNHPAMLSNEDEFIKLSKTFFSLANY